MVSGIVALMLEANPKLNWKEVQAILIKTSRVVDESDSDWVTNGGKYKVNHKYGYGLVDAKAAVEMAKNWNDKTYHKNINIYTLTKVEDSTTLSSTKYFVSKIEVPTNKKVEHVKVIFNSNFPISGALRKKKHFITKKKI